MSAHIKEIKDRAKSTAYEPALCGIRDYGQLHYATVDPASEENVSFIRQEIASGDLSNHFCFACRAEFPSRFPSTTFGRLAPVCFSKGVQQ
jgi:hypothetical protein